jgi:hypothetical protein
MNGILTVLMGLVYLGLGLAAAAIIVAGFFVGALLISFIVPLVLVFALGYIAYEIARS